MAKPEVTHNYSFSLSQLYLYVCWMQLLSLLLICVHIHGSYDASSSCNKSLVSIFQMHDWFQLELSIIFKQGITISWMFSFKWRCGLLSRWWYGIFFVKWWFTLSFCNTLIFKSCSSELQKPVGKFGWCVFWLWDLTLLTLWLYQRLSWMTLFLIRRYAQTVVTVVIWLLLEGIKIEEVVVLLLCNV